MLEISFGLLEEAKTVTNAVSAALKAGYRTADIADSNTPKEKILGTKEMGQQVLAFVKK